MQTSSDQNAPVRFYLESWSTVLKPQKYLFVVIEAKGLEHKH